MHIEVCPQILVHTGKYRDILSCILYFRQMAVLKYFLHCKPPRLLKSADEVMHVPACIPCYTLILVLALHRPHCRPNAYLMRLRPEHLETVLKLKRPPELVSTTLHTHGTHMHLTGVANTSHRTLLE